MRSAGTRSTIWQEDHSVQRKHTPRIVSCFPPLTFKHTFEMTWYVSKMLPPDQCTSGCQAYRENWDLEPGKVKKMHFPKLVDAKKEMFKNKAQTNMMTKISTNNLIKKRMSQQHIFNCTCLNTGCPLLNCPLLRYTPVAHPFSRQVILMRKL